MYPIQIPVSKPATTFQKGCGYLRNEEGGFALQAMKILKRTKGIVVDTFMNWGNLWWECLTVDNKNWWFKMEKPTSHTCLLNTMIFGFWMILHCWATLYFRSDSAMPCHCYYSWQKNVHGISMGLEPCWRKGCVPPILVPTSSSQLLAELGSLTHRGENWLSYQRVLQQQVAVDAFYFLCFLHVRVLEHGRRQGK